MCCLVQLLLVSYLPELEQLKASLDIKGQSTEAFFSPPPHAHGSNTMQLATSNLPELDWDQLSSTPAAPQAPAAVPTASQAAQPNDPFAYDPAATQHTNNHSIDPFAASQPASSYSGSAPSASTGALDLLTGSAAYSQYGQGAPAASASSYTRSSSLKLPIASQAALSRHAIMPQQQARRQPASRPSQHSLYPQFNKEPLAPVDYGMSNGAEASAPALPDQMASLQLQQGPNLMDAPAVSMPSPQLEMQLGPQQVQVGPCHQSMPCCCQGYNRRCMLVHKCLPACLQVRHAFAMRLQQQQDGVMTLSLCVSYLACKLPQCLTCCCLQGRMCKVIATSNRCRYLMLQHLWQHYRRRRATAASLPQCPAPPLRLSSRRNRKSGRCIYRLLSWRSSSGLHTGFSCMP